MNMIVGVLLPLPFNRVFDYKTEENLQLGQIVQVPFGSSGHGGMQIGVVWKLGASAKLEDKKIKKIAKVYSFSPLSAAMRRFISFVAEYNLAFSGLVLKMVLSAKQAFVDPKQLTLYTLSGRTISESGLKNSAARWRVIELLRRIPCSKDEIKAGAGVGDSVIKTMLDAGILKPLKQEIKKEFSSPCGNYCRVNLTAEQESAAALLSAKVNNGFSATLLDGVTGSGKTEVYFETATKVFESGKQVLILLPEISLTTQWLNRFEKRFGVAPAKWHSGLGDRERADTWRAVVEGRVQVVVGARSALFLPFRNLGLIIVDESHDSSYKQEDTVNYQGRDMAVARAKLEQIPIILATATPDLETICNVEEGKYDAVYLRSRYAQAELPDINIIDMKKNKPQKGEWGVSWLSPPLVDALAANLKKNEQSVLFLNRRGYAPLLVCRDCGFKISCPNCTAWLTEHKKTKSLICHHCGYTSSIPPVCPDCGSEDGLTACGPGVERIAEEVKWRFPEAKIRILSSDITASLKEVSEVIREMEENRIDVLIGTQILAKGHHFPALTLVGIVDADLGLIGSDLRASERTFQLLSQVSGRAGRGEKKGSVYLQTLYPDNAVLNALVSGNREAFLTLEKQSRQILHFPPFGRLAAIIVSGANQEQTERTAVLLGQQAPQTNLISTLGPAPAPIAVLRNKYRYRLLLKTAKNIKIQDVVSEWLRRVPVPASVWVEADIDPYSFL